MLPRGELRCTQRGEAFSENCVFAITLVAPTDPQMSQGVNTFPSQSVTGNGNAKMHSFLSQRYFGGSHFSSFGKSIESMCQKKVDVVQNRQCLEPQNCCEDVQTKRDTPEVLKRNIGVTFEH